MFQHEDIDEYSFKEIPLNQDCFLISEKYMEKFSVALLSMLAGEDINPHEVGYGSYVSGRQVNQNSLDLSWYPNVHMRFHEVSISIPKGRIVTCVGCWKYDVKPYIFIERDWLEQLYTREYSIFALIDAIGVKDAIQNNLLTKDKLIELRNRIDALAEKHSDVSFISFADSLILKSNWSAGYFHKGVDCSYDPESILNIISEIQKIYRDVLSLEVYSVLTQGSNEYYEESLLHLSPSKNHICLNSLGVPFAELLAIEKAAKLAIKNGTHGPTELYMDEQYYHSLDFKLEYEKNNKPRNRYQAIMKAEVPSYFYASCSDIMGNLRSVDERDS